MRASGISPPIVEDLRNIPYLVDCGWTAHRAAERHGCCDVGSLDGVGALDVRLRASRSISSTGQVTTTYGNHLTPLC